MEWFIGFLGAIIGTAVGGLSVFLTTRAQMRRELHDALDAIAAVSAGPPETPP